MKIYLIFSIVTLFLSSRAYANIPLIASKTESYYNGYECLIYNDKVSLEIGSNSKFHIKETSTDVVDTNDIKASAPSLLKHKKQATYRWSPHQINYSVQNAQSDLEIFFSIGYSTVLNSSPEADYIVNTIDYLCDVDLFNFQIIGKFQIDLQIGNTLFKDQLIVQRTKGKYIVPGSFESDLESLKYDNGQFEFTIHVQEGNDDYIALFKGSIDDQSSPHHLAGKAYILPDMKLLGEFTGSRK